MAKPKIPNQKKANQSLIARLQKYVLQVQAVYDGICSKIGSAVELTDYDGVKEFSFGDYPELSAPIKSALNDYVSSMGQIIYSGTSKEWRESNLLQDLLAEKVLKAYDLDKGGDKYKRYFQPNSDALKAFQERAVNGMKISDNLWVQAEGVRKELECAISAAIDRGQSAITLSKRLSQYLNDFPSLQKDYGEKFGKAAKCKDCEYASMRLARSEINMAYRTAEHKRWQQFDFILGFEVKLSGRHPANDICNDLAGKYPKEFKFVGWHPNCMCYAVPIVMSDDDYYAKPSNRKEKVITTAQPLREWLNKNRSRINKSALPYFLSDNKRYWDWTVEEAREQRHSTRNVKAIRQAARNRTLLKQGYGVDETLIAQVRKDAIRYNVDAKSLNEYIYNHKFDESFGVMTDSQEAELSEIVEKINQRIEIASQKFEEFKSVYIEKARGKYDFGSWRGSVRKRFSSIKPTIYRTVQDLKKDVKDLYSKVKAERNVLTSSAVRPTSEVKDIKNFSFVNASASESVKYIESQLTLLYGKTLDYSSELWERIQKKVKQGKVQEAIDAYKQELNCGLSSALKSITHLRQLERADMSILPNSWIGRFNDYIKTIDSCNVDKYGYLYIYREIEGAYNMLQLANDEKLKLFGLGKISYNTPYGLVKGFRELGYCGRRWLAQKKFYDSFDKFVPFVSVVDGNFDAWFSSKYNHVAYNFGALKSRFSDDKWYRKGLQYHEFGHAKDWLQGGWRKSQEWKDFYNKWQAELSSKYEIHEGCPIWTPKKLFNDSVKRHEIDLLRDEKYGAVSDTLQAIWDKHEWIGKRGHFFPYFDNGREMCLAEIIAHMSELYWTKHSAFDEVIPGFVKEGTLLYRSFLFKK